MIINSKTIIILSFLLLIICIFLNFITFVLNPINLSLNKFQTYPPINEKYSIIIPSHQIRIDCLAKQIIKLINGTPKYLDKIYIRWIDCQNPIPNLSDIIGNISNEQNIITILGSPNCSITDRFLIPDDIKTKTIISLDDDINIEANELDLGFEYYIKNSLENRIFGHAPRSCHNDLYYFGPFSNTEYNIVITSFTYLNIDMLKLFNSEKYRDLVLFSDFLHNGEDILMNYIVQQNYLTYPVIANFKINRDHIKFPKNGISNGPNHKIKRDLLCRTFTKYLGKLNYSSTSLIRLR